MVAIKVIKDFLAKKAAFRREFQPEGADANREGVVGLRALLDTEAKQDDESKRKRRKLAM